MLSPGYAFGKSLFAKAKDWVTRKRAVGGACPIGCFTAKMQVLAATGLVSIASIAVGDQVYGLDEQTGEIELHTVTDVVMSDGAPLMLVTLAHAAGHLETIETTDDHPFWLQFRAAGSEAGLAGHEAAQGETSRVASKSDGSPVMGWVPAQQLRPGDRLTTLGGTTRVQSVTYTSARATVYNLTVAGVSNYLIGPDGVWVHNCHEHHAWPKFLGGKTLQDLVSMPKVLHENFHGDLFRALHAAGITRSEPRMTWANYFKDNPDKQAPAMAALMEVSSRYDNIYHGRPDGHKRSLVAALQHEMSK